MTSGKSLVARLPAFCRNSNTCVANCEVKAQVLDVINAHPPFFLEVGRKSGGGGITVGQYSKTIERGPPLFIEQSVALQRKNCLCMG